MNENFSIDPDPKFILKKKKKRRKYYEIKINFHELIILLPERIRSSGKNKRASSNF